MGCDARFEPEEQSQVNEELLRRVIKRIERDQNWDQDFWGIITDDKVADKLDVEDLQLASGFKYLRLGDAELQTQQDICGTAFCMAGQTVLEAGETLLMDRDTLEASNCLTSEGEFRSVYERAKQLLGITYDQAAVIFSGPAGDCGFEGYKRLVANTTGVTLD